MTAFAKRTIFVLIGAAAGLIALEAGFRLHAWARPGHSPGNQFSAFDPYLGWGHIPGAEEIYRRAETSARVRINVLGLRGEPPAAGGFRILLLGDSVTAAFEVEEKETFRARLEGLLRRCAGGGAPRYEVLNAGVRGYGTDQALLYYGRKGKSLGAGLVVYTLVHNDIFENTKTTGLNDYYPKPRFRLRDGKLELENVPLSRLGRPGEGLFASLHRTLRLRSRAYGWAAAQTARIGAGPPAWLTETFPEYALPPADERRRGRVSLFQALLARLNRAARGNGARLVLQIFPGRWEFSREVLARTMAPVIPSANEKNPPLDPDAFHAAYLAVAERLGIPAVETLPPFRAAAAGGMRLHTADAHLNVAGHALLARILARGLVRQGLIPLPPGERGRCLREIESAPAAGGEARGGST